MTDWRCCDSILQDQRTHLHEAARGGHTPTAEVLLKVGADVKATGKVRGNVLIAIILFLCSLSVSTAFQYINKSAACLVQFSPADNVFDTDQQELHLDPTSDSVQPPIQIDRAVTRLCRMGELPFTKQQEEVTLPQQKSCWRRALMSRQRMGWGGMCWLQLYLKCAFSCSVYSLSIR